MKDIDIIKLYWDRKESAISATAEKYGRYCHTISYNILHNNEDAAECVNDTYLKTWNSIPPKHPECLSSYLGKITRNLSLNCFKRYSTQKRGFGQTALALSELEECIPNSVTVEQVMDEKYLVDALNTFLYAQPELQRNIFIRRYWYLYTISDIAAHYDMSKSKVSSLLFRMRKQLKHYLEKEGIVL